MAIHRLTLDKTTLNGEIKGGGGGGGGRRESLLLEEASWSKKCVKFFILYQIITDKHLL